MLREVQFELALAFLIDSARSRTLMTKDLKQRQFPGSNITSDMQLKVRPTGCKVTTGLGDECVERTCMLTSATAVINSTATVPEEAQRIG